MNTKFGRVLVCLLLLAALTLLFSLPLAAQPVSQKPSNPKSFALPDRSAITSHSDAARQKLSPDLRVAAKAGGDTQHLVYALIQTGASVARYMERSVTSRPLGELQWVTGEVRNANLLKLASANGVIAVASAETFQPVPAPGLDTLRSAPAPLSTARISELLAKGGKTAVLSASRAAGLALPATAPARPDKPSVAPNAGDSVKVVDIHHVDEAHEAGYTGTGVVAAVVDTGVDFGNSDLQGTQARLSGGAYDGWPFAYDTISGINYALAELTIGPDNYWSAVNGTLYAHTLPVEDAVCDEGVCTGALLIDYGELSGYPWPSVTLDFTWPDTSLSGTYYYTVHPLFSHINAGFNLGLGYAYANEAPAAVIVADEATAGVYDTVYTDADFDQDLVEEKPMSKGDELSGADVFDATQTPGTDGRWDLSVSMLTWIADGENPPPGVSTLYPGVATPEAGRLITFVNDAESHGTNVASMIAAQSVMSDPAWLGPVNPLFAGAADAEGVGGPVLAGMAPDAHIAAFMNGFDLPLDAWTLAALGFDGAPESGDEVQVVNNSWGDSFTNEDGWDAVSRFVHYVNRNYAPATTFLAATGNGGPGYGTTTSPNGATIFKVGASTSYGTSLYFEWVPPEQFTYGAVQPWSNRGPSSLGDVDPDLVCVGAWGLGADPLNLYPNGEAAYDLFGGTSMASPVCTGIAALVYDSFYEAHGRWPTWQETADILSNGADDLGYDVLTQGAGNADAFRSTTIAADEAAYVTPGQVIAGDYRGVDYTPGFPAIVHPGDTFEIPLTVRNPTDAPFGVALQDVALQRTHEVSFTVTLDAGHGDFTIPDYLLDITDLVEEQDPDLVRAHVMYPSSIFDTDGDYFADNLITTLFYDWSDVNDDGNLWTDDNNNGLVEPDEIDINGPGAYEFNRYTYSYPTANYMLADLGGDALARRHDGVFFGLQRSFGSEDLEVTVTLSFYQYADWDWLSLPAAELEVPAGGQSDVTATLTVPEDARVGLYEGAVRYNEQIVPVIVHVAAGSTTFSFGAATLDEPMGDTLYDNGHLFGSTDWGWRPETGDWKHFFFDVPDGVGGPGEAMIVETDWVYGDPAPEPPPLPESVLFEGFDEGIPDDWEVVNNDGDCEWTVTSLIDRSNLTGGAGDAADADSDACGPDTTMDTELYTPAIDLSAYDEIWLAFRTSYRGWFDDLGDPVDHGYVEISTNGGDDWSILLELVNDTTHGQVVDLSDYIDEGEVMLRFHYVAPGWHWWWQVDEVGLYLEDPSASFVVEIPDRTDVDTAIYVAAPDDFATGDPDFFGPSGVALAGGSDNAWLGAGTWAFDTATDGSKEVAGGPLGDGLGYVSLHNVLNAGRATGEPVVGNAYQLSVDPVPLIGVADTPVEDAPNTLSTQWQVTVESTADIEEGLGVLGFGMSKPIDLQDEVIHQDDPNDPCTSSWVEGIAIQQGGLLEITTSSAMVGLDIDLYLLLDGGDGTFDCADDLFIAGSTTATADEHVKVTMPPDGLYWVLVHGWNVPGGESTFDISIDAIQGDDLMVTNIPDGPLTANEAITFDVIAAVPDDPGTTWEGLLYLGPADAPTALVIPVTVTVPEAAGGGELVAHFKAEPDALATGDSTTFTLWVWNHDSQAENVGVTIDVPPGLVVDPGSLSASSGNAVFNIANRTVSWSDTLPAGGALTITFDATAGSPAAKVEVQATVTGQIRGTQQVLTAPVWLNVDRPPLLIFLPANAGG